MQPSPSSFSGGTSLQSALESQAAYAEQYAHLFNKESQDDAPASNVWDGGNDSAQQQEPLTRARTPEIRYRQAATSQQEERQQQMAAAAAATVAGDSAGSDESMFSRYRDLAIWMTPVLLGIYFLWSHIGVTGSGPVTHRSERRHSRSHRRH